jgi:hypothetical protein
MGIEGVHGCIRVANEAANSLIKLFFAGGFAHTAPHLPNPPGDIAMRIGLPTGDQEP